MYGELTRMKGVKMPVFQLIITLAVIGAAWKIIVAIIFSMRKK